MNNISPLWLSIGLVCSVLIAGCGQKGVLVRNPDAAPERPVAIQPRPAPTLHTTGISDATQPNANADTEASVLAQASALIERQAAAIARLEEELATVKKQASQHGSGAYRQGSGLGVVNGGNDSLLDQLSQLREQLATSHAAQDTYQQQNISLRQRLEHCQEQITQMDARLALMPQLEENLDRRLQELHERQRIIETSQAQLTASEVERLRVEKRYFDLVRELISLRSDESERLIDLQNRLRNTVRSTRPEDLSEDPSRDPSHDLSRDLSKVSQ